MFNDFILNKKNLSNKNNRAFTLIELLIVISVIGVLSGITLRVINIGDLNKKARDSQRVADVKKIQTALELYFVDKRIYPKYSDIEITGSDALSNELLNSKYIDVMPLDPSGVNYRYYSSSGTTYIIRFPSEFSTINNCSAGTFGSKYGCSEYKNPF